MTIPSAQKISYRLLLTIPEAAQVLGSADRSCISLFKQMKWPQSRLVDPGVSQLWLWNST